MMIPEAIPQEYSTIVLVLLLVVTFVIAFKVMELIVETLMVSALSAAFYTGYTALIGGGLSQLVLNDLLLFAVLGAAFYMAYSFLSSAYTITRKVIHFPWVILKSIYRGTRHVTGKVYSMVSEAREKDESVDVREDADKEENDSNSKVKEVVLSQEDEEDEKKEED